MYQRRPNLMIGFHGCDQSVRDQLVTIPDKVKKSHEIHDWLGNGFYIWENKHFDTARGIFTEGGPAFEGAGIQTKNHIQVCIRNLNCIKGFFIPRKEIRFP